VTVYWTSVVAHTMLKNSVEWIFSGSESSNKLSVHRLVNNMSSGSWSGENCGNCQACCWIWICWTYNCGFGIVRIDSVASRGWVSSNSGLSLEEFEALVENARWGPKIGKNHHIIKSSFHLIIQLQYMLLTPNHKKKSHYKLSCSMFCPPYASID
jgi:hypothetical protein